MLRFFVLVPVLVLLVASPARASTSIAPTSAPGYEAAAAPAAAAPARLRIAAIGLNEPLVSVGLDAQRYPIVPKRNVGWYMHSARPGQGENVVMWGHVLRWKDSPAVPAPFARLKEVKVGAEVAVVRNDGRVHRYQVTRKVWVRPTQVQYILPVGSERLTLVTCIGDNMIRNGALTKEFRLIMIAEPVL